MKRPAKSTLAILILLSLAAAAEPKASPRTIQGTIQAVEVRTGRVDVITGVGMALRLVRIQTTPATQIAARGAAAPLKRLAPGDVVRAVCRVTDEGLVADRIDRTETP